MLVICTCFNLEYCKAVRGVRENDTSQKPTIPPKRKHTRRGRRGRGKGGPGEHDEQDEMEEPEEQEEEEETEEEVFAT